MTHVRQCGTPSCATSAQERTGCIVVMHFSLNILRHHPCDQYMTHNGKFVVPLAARQAPNERTGYIVVMHFSLNILRHHPCDQYMTHNGKFVVPLAARPAPKSVPATLFFILAIHT